MALLTEPNVIGKREDLMDLLALVDAKDTPIVSMAKKGRQLGNTYFRWQADSLPAPIAGGTIDGTDVSAYDNYTNNDGQTPNTGGIRYRTELSNYAQIFRRAVRVSPLTQDVANIAGVRDALAYEVSKALTGVKRDMEVTFGSNQTAQADSGVAPYRTAGLQTWINAAGTGTGGAIPTNFRTPSNSIVTGANASGLTDVAVQDLLKSIYEQRGQLKTYDCVVGTSLKRAFTSLLSTTTLSTISNSTNTLAAGATKVQTFNRDAGDSAFIQSVQIFEGDFGTLRLHPSTFVSTISGSTITNTNYKGLVLDMDLIEVRFGGSGTTVSELPNAGGGPARLVQAVAGLVVGNPLGLGKFDYSAA
jgi:hypothetical protein